MATLSIRLIGRPNVLVDGNPLVGIRSYKKAVALLATLALGRNREVSRDLIIDRLWPECADPQARAYLRQLLTELRRALGEESARIQSCGRSHLRLDPDATSVDLWRLEDVMRIDAGRALDTYAARLLEGVDADWAITAQQDIEARLVDHGEVWATLRPAAEAARLLARLVKLDPYRETTRQSLMRALFEAGDEASAKARYLEFRRLLRSELGIEPSLATNRLYFDICRSVRPLPTAIRPGSRLAA